MSANSQMKGARLEFVVRQLKGKRTKVAHSFNPKTRKIEATKTEEDAGYMLYLPSGQSYRLSATELVERKYDRQPEIINLDKVQDTKTPAGRFKFALDEKRRQ